MKKRFLLIFCIIPCMSYAQQIFDNEMASEVLRARDSYLNAYRQMSLRAAQIRQIVQPYRELQYQYYRDGQYEEAIKVCCEVIDKYIYYKFDNKAISDMESIAGDCAVRIGLYDSAISFYKMAKEADYQGANSKLSQVFNLKMADARASYRDRKYSDLWNDVTTALKTGWESGECYYYYGVCYERNNMLKDAKKMYKLAQKKKYSLATTALRELKKRKK